MKLTRREQLAAAMAAALGLGLLAALLLDSWRWSLVFVAALMVLLSGVILLALRRQELTRKADLERMERKIDNLALRVVTESQATHRELAGLIEDLAGRVHGGDVSTPSS
jgi:membrane protein implicated in regulation of membrane protease activity